MSLLVNKLYLTNDTPRVPTFLELKGNVSIQIYGGLDKPTNISDLVLQGEIIEEDGEYPLHGLPRYVVFVGNADKINVEGYDFTLIGDIT